MSRDLKGLLKFCMEHTKGEDAAASDAVSAMSAEDQKWLREMIDTHTVDVIKEFTLAIDILGNKDVVWNRDADEEKLEEALHALGCLEDWVGNIDLATNFEQLGGLSTLALCLQSPSEEIIVATCNVIAEASQNHEYFQAKVVDSGLLEAMVNILDDENRSYADGVKVKALYGVSCSLRGSVTAIRAFLDAGGVRVMHAALDKEETPHPKLVHKTCFLLLALMRGDDVPDGTGAEEKARVRREVAAAGFADVAVRLAMEPLDEERLEVHVCLMRFIAELRKVVNDETISSISGYYAALDGHAKTLQVLDQDGLAGEALVAVRAEMERFPKELRIL